MVFLNVLVFDIFKEGQISLRKKIRFMPVPCLVIFMGSATIFPCSKAIVISFLKKIFDLFILERGREGERDRVKHQCVVASRLPPTADLACNPGMYPDWESNQQPFAS